MEEEYLDPASLDNWIESVNILTGKRVCFRVQDITRAEEGGSLVGTKLVYLSGYECEITMGYDDFCEIRSMSQVANLSSRRGRESRISMALPEALRLNKREREHQELVEFVNYLQANVAREGFFGKSLLPSLETLTALAEGMKRYDEDYGQKPVVKNETSVHRLTGWKSEGMQEVG